MVTGGRRDRTWLLIPCGGAAHGPFTGWKLTGARGGAEARSSLSSGNLGEPQ